MLGYWAMRFVSWIMCISPKFLRKLYAAILGNIAWLAVPKWRKGMAVENVKECLGADENRAQIIVRESVTRFGRMIVEVLRFPLLNKQNLAEVVKVEGEVNLQLAAAKDKGVILCSGHYGNWELLGATVGLLGYPVLSIARKQNNQGMNRFINEYREMVGQQIAYNHGDNSMMAISRILRDRKLLGILYDQDTGHDGVEMIFFGHQSVTPPGAAILSRLHGSPIVPLFIHNNPDGTVTAKIYPALYTPKTKDKQADIAQTMEELIIIAEQEIISDPAMWFWVHDRWKDGREKYKKRQERGLN